MTDVKRSGAAGLLLAGVGVFSSGCVSQALYQAKVDELDRVRAEHRDRDSGIAGRLDRLSTHLQEIERRLLQTEASAAATSLTLGQIRDQTTQINQQVMSLRTPPPATAPAPTTTPPNGGLKPFPSAGPQKPPFGLRDPFARPPAKKPIF